MVEFTGERVVPGQVEPDLWSEHLARYAFASRYAAGKRVLDCGCGTGYGTAELAETATEVTGLDVAADAIDYAHENFSCPNVRYVTASCLDIPFPTASFDLVVAFEVIEHLDGFRRFLDESARVLAPGGLFIVSTPNKPYYSESRATSGPNPFHTHEFESAEFQTELHRVFPCVAMLVQNHVECFSFDGSSTSSADARIDGEGASLDDAHFFIALAGKTAVPPVQSFIYVPRTVNLLREREKHIALLKEQLQATQNWLSQTQQDRDSLLGKHRELQTSYDIQNLWARTLEADLQAARDNIGRLQQEMAAQEQAATTVAAGYQAKVEELEVENLAKTQWALDTEQRLSAEVDRVARDLESCIQLLQTAEDTVVERTVWARKLEAERLALEAQLNAIRASRWVKLGRKLGLGPAVQ